MQRGYSFIIEKDSTGRDCLVKSVKMYNPFYNCTVYFMQDDRKQGRYSITLSAKPKRTSLPALTWVDGVKIAVESAPFLYTPIEADSLAIAVNDAAQSARALTGLLQEKYSRFLKGQGIKS